MIIAVIVGCIFYTVLTIATAYYSFKIGLNLGLSSVRPDGEKAQFHPLQRVLGKPKVAIASPSSKRVSFLRKTKKIELPEGFEQFNQE